MTADVFLKLSDIAGEFADDKYKDWIEISQYRFGVRQPTSFTASSNGGATSGQSTLMELSRTKRLDQSSPKLFEASCSGRHLKAATLAVNRAGGDKLRYFEIQLEEVIISEFVHGNADGEGEPFEEVRLNYGRIKTRYVKQRRANGQGGGVIAGGWDRIKNQILG
jgi:type VI secretion system Hcp family effector